MKRSAVVQLGSHLFAYCEVAIGREYYNPIAYFEELAYAKAVVRGPQDEKIIIAFTRKYVVTTKEPDEHGIKKVWARCDNFSTAQLMRDR